MAPRPTPDPTIGERIRDRRTLRKWSVRQAANRAGVSPSTWSRIERGSRSLDNRFMLADIAAALDCSVAELAGRPATVSDPAIAAAESGVAAIRRALIEAAPDEPTERDAQPIEQLKQRVDLTRDLYRRCDYAGAVRLLPDVVLDLHAAAHGRHWAAALPMTVQMCLAAMATLKHLGHPAESWLAAERGKEAAQRLGQPVAMAVAEFGRSCAATASDGFKRSNTLAVRGVHALQPHLAKPMALEALGLLTLRIAFSSAGLRRVDDAHERFSEAGRIAEQTGESHSWDMFFGPTNVNVWRVGVETDLGNPGRAVEIGNQVTPAVLGAPVRESMFYLDMARALSHTRRDAEGKRMLLAAERLAPQRVRSSPLAREAGQAMHDRALRRSEAAALKAFLERAGMPA
jgi:transcriptional regulator with XRE-family HTH domain